MRAVAMSSAGSLVIALVVVGVSLSKPLEAADFDADVYRQSAQSGGDPVAGRQVFHAKQTRCDQCHGLTADAEAKTGPRLTSIGDKLTRSQIIDAILNPTARIHPDFATRIVTTVDGSIVKGVVYRREPDALTLHDAAGKQVRLSTEDIEQEVAGKESLMPANLAEQISADAFADLIAFLESLKQDPAGDFPGMPDEIPMVNRPAVLQALNSPDARFDHPVWIQSLPGQRDTYLVVEQQTRKILLWDRSTKPPTRRVFVDLSKEAITGTYEGVMCLALHPEFLSNRKYYVNYHVREAGVFSPVIVQRTADAQGRRDSGTASKRILKIPQDTDLHWGGMLAFGPDRFLYIGAGDGGPQEDPDGNGQNLSRLRGKILRIDVDQGSAGLPYSIPKSNPFSQAAPPVRREIWGYGFRMPWRFSWDSQTGDMWVGDIGQNLFEEVSMPRIGENHGWNVYEGLVPFSQQYKRPDEDFAKPVFSYRRRHGVSVTGGYVYRGARSPSFVGAYVFADFESKRVWALTQQERQLVQVRQIAVCPERPASFGMNHDGELLIVGYAGTIYQLKLDDAAFP